MGIEGENLKEPGPLHAEERRTIDEAQPPAVRGKEKRDGQREEFGVEPLDLEERVDAMEEGPDRLQTRTALEQRHGLEEDEGIGIKPRPIL